MSGTSAQQHKSTLSTTSIKHTQQCYFKGPTQTTQLSGYKEFRLYVASFIMIFIPDYKIVYKLYMVVTIFVTATNKVTLSWSVLSPHLHTQSQYHHALLNNHITC